MRAENAKKSSPVYQSCIKNIREVLSEASNKNARIRATTRQDDLEIIPLLTTAQALKIEDLIRSIETASKFIEAVNEHIAVFNLPLTPCRDFETARLRNDINTLLFQYRLHMGKVAPRLAYGSVSEQQQAKQIAGNDTQRRVAV